MDRPPNDENAHNLFPLLKKRPTTNQDLPALPEDRIFEMHNNADVPVLINSPSSPSSSKMKKKIRCLTIPRPPRWLRHASSWLYAKTGAVITYAVFFLLVYLILWIFADKEALPAECYDYTDLILPGAWYSHTALCFGGRTLSIALFYAFAFASGQVAEYCRMPGLAGMLLSGLFLRCISSFITPYDIIVDGMPTLNVNMSNSSLPSTPIHLLFPNASRLISKPLVTFAATLRVNKNLSGFLRQIALATILTRAGLGLKPSTLRRTWRGVIRLTCIPCITEALVCTLVAKYLMNWPWSWAFMMGFVLAAVSPAVVVPNMLKLEMAGWGMAAGIPTLIMAAASLDDVLAITGFGIAQAIAFSEGQIWVAAIKGPLGVLVGALAGLLIAVIVCVLPPPGTEHGNSLRGMLLYGISIVAILGTLKMDLSGAGALCCLVCAICCSYGWQHGLPWIFKQSSLGAANGLTRDSHNTKNKNLGEGREEADLESNRRRKNYDSEDSEERSEGGPATIYHEYYSQHIKTMKRMLKKSGGVVGSKNALTMISKSNRRFSLPEPKPDYEEDEFDEFLGSTEFNPWVKNTAKNLKSRDDSTIPDRKRHKILARSYSATRQRSSRSRPGLNMDVSNATAAAAAGSSVNNESLTLFGKSPTVALERTTSEVAAEAKRAELLELAKEKGNRCLKVMQGFVSTCWWFLQPLLFCLIGADIPVDKIKPYLLLKGVGSIGIALSFRLLGTFLAVLPSKMNMKERLFVAIAWIPKATVQAAIGPIALDAARKSGDPEQIKWGEEVLTLAAIAIVVTAPAAAICIPLIAPRLLSQSKADLPPPETPNQDAGGPGKIFSKMRNQNPFVGSNWRPKIGRTCAVVSQDPELENSAVTPTRETAL